MGKLKVMHKISHLLCAGPIENITGGKIVYAWYWKFGENGLFCVSGITVFYLSTAVNLEWIVGSTSNLACILIYQCPKYW